MTKLARFDAADYLDSEEVMAASAKSRLLL
jgi:hypothetical protein